MLDPQPLRVTMEFTFEAPVYEGDPNDAFEIARLEQENLEKIAGEFMESLFDDVEIVKVEVKPA